MRTILILLVASLSYAIAAPKADASKKEIIWDTSAFEGIAFGIDDEEKLKDEALRTHKVILVVFLSSNRMSVKLEKEVLSQPEFLKYAKYRFLIIKAEHLQHVSQPEATRAKVKAFCQKYNVKSFPTVLVLTPKMELVARTGYRAGGAEKFIDYLKHVLE